MNKELYHYGVLGMKWGVRKSRYKSSYDSDIVLKKGSSIQNISGGKARYLNNTNVLYVAHTKKDRLRYKDGYDAILDINDINRGYKTDQPVIIFDPSERLKSTKPVELTQTEIDRALKEYDELSRR